jgi:predicted transposase YbfD/YdcC
VVPETSREQALEFARLAGQESLFDLETFENIKTGATGENPMKFTPEQHREISKALKEGRMPNVFGTTAETTNNLLTKENVKEFASKQKTTAHKLIVKAAKMVLNAIPGIKIYIHNNGQEMVSAVDSLRKQSSKQQLTKEEKTGIAESSGLYVDGAIHIDLESATIKTVFHEAFHALTEKMGMSSEATLLMAKGLKNIISNKDIKQKLENFISQYETEKEKFKEEIEKENKKRIASGKSAMNEKETDEYVVYLNDLLKSDEFLAELTGILSEAEQELTTTKLQQFKTLINNIAKKLGLPVIFSASATAQDAADFINTMSKKLRTGKEIKDLSAEGKDGKIKRQILSNIDINKVRSKDRPGKKVSKGLSVKMVDGKKVIEETEDLSLEYVKENAPSIFISNANIIARYPLVVGKQKFKKASTIDEAQNIYDVFIREVANNLNYLMAEFKSDLRDLATLWYDGANALANDFADKFGISAEQAAGIIASMSPQKDWYQNVRLAELVMMAYKDNPVMTQSMIDYQKTVNEKGLYDGATSPGKKLKKAEKAYSESRTKLNKEVLEKAKVKMEEAIVKTNAVITMLDKYVGKKLNDTPQYVQPYMVRTYHEVNTTKDYNIVAPDGSVQGVAKKKNGANAKVAWGSYSEIGKAVSIINDGSQENITKSLGQMHKIRNFHNNIIDPMSKDGDVTMDTHAIAAALLLPLSGNSTQVGQNFGTNTSNSGPLGIKGLYYAYAEAYALAAKEAGLLPRQVQSITWEAVRGLYTDTFKSNKNLVAKINNIWKNYEDGKITVNEAREQSKEAAGGIQDPTWAGGPIQDKSGEGIGQEGIGTGSKGDGRDIVGGKLGGDIEDQPSKIKFQKNKTDKLTAPVAGNKLFNEPLKQALDIAKSYMKSIGKEYIPVEKITKLDEGLSKRISDAYDKMKDDPTNPEVKAAYEAMAKETLDQYDAITAKGYKLEINNNEPYSSSEDMINDLRDNNRMKIFSTESGFGEEPITDKQREENILLKDSGRKDANGETLLVNDVFRFVHDFFGHAKLGNSFGPIGEENAWRVHSEMYSPEAKKAMTSETRGQNSWVNFSGVNDAAFKKREKARQLRKEGKIDQANQMVGEVYDEMKFADQKIGLLPSFAVEEGAPSKIKKQLTQNWAATPVKSMMNSPIAKNSDNLRSVAIDLVKGKINQGEYADAVKKYSPIGSIGTLFAPSTLSHMITALGKKAGKLMAPVVDELGKKIKRVGLRLDIPSYLHHNAWIVTVHDGRVKNGNVISYRNAARLKNVEFTTDPKVALNIAAGFNSKGTFARMEGEMVDIPGETAEEQGLNAQAMIEEIMNDPSWVQVGMNPFRHSFFWNRANGAPVISADEVIQVGGLVYAKNVIEASPNSDRFTVYGKYDETTNKVVKSDEPLLDKSGSSIKFQKTRQETRMDNEAEAIFKKSLDRGVPWNFAIQNVIDYIQISKWYEEASDIDREQKIRDFKISKKQKLKKAPSVAKIMGTPKPTMVTVNEMTSMRDQIKLEARAAREAKGDLNQKRKLLSTAIKGLVKLGKLTTRQAAIIIDRIGYVNLDNQVMVNRLADYAARVFEKADYQERLSRAFSFRKGIRKLLKGDIQAEVVGMAKKFSKIDPSMVDDIEKYLEMAEIVKNAIKPSKINRKDLDVNMRESMNIDSVSEFTNDAIENQERILKEELLAVHSELVDAGVIDNKMSLSEIESTISSLKEKEDNANYKADILTFLSKRIDTMSAIIKDILIFKINPMTGEKVALTEKNIDLISRMLNIDINNVSIKEAIFIAEAMDNFINNNITSSVEAVIEKHEGATELENLIADKVVASPLRKYFSTYAGQLFSEQVASMPILFEKLFVGAKKGLMVAKKMGWTALINGVNKAEKMFNTTVDSYFKQYSKTKPNGKSFNDAENVYERGMLAFLSRNVSGTVTQQAEEFKRRVEVLKESIKSLLEGSTKEQKMGELYQKVYDKLNVESGDIDVIHANADKINRSAVGWWINQWGTTYSDLSDISLSVYNTVLSSDTSYTTDRYKLLGKSTSEEIIDPKTGSFGRDIEFLDKNKAGVMMPSTKPSASAVSNASRYISLDFDVNNTSAYKGALIDINTAAAIRKIDGFINSDNLAKLIPTEDDRKIFTGRIKDYIQAAKNKMPLQSDKMRLLDQLTNFLGGIGVAKALGGIDQVVKQTLPIALSTFVNSGRFDLVMPGSSASVWIDSLGMAISNRGQESQSTIESVDRRLEKASGLIDKSTKVFVDVQQFWLKYFLSKPDVFIAKSSFISYYKQYLSNNNQSTDIDWATHNVNQDAADYAMLMVDRQQNVSDTKMAGKIFSSQDSTKKIMRKIFLPFASFSLNQKSRMVSDIKVLGMNSGASKQDKAIAARSLASLPFEMALYQSMSLAIRLGYLAIAKGIIGAVADDDDEEKERLLGIEISKELKNATKYPLRSMITDFLSPAPILDNLVVGGANALLRQSEDKEMIDDAVSKKNLMLEVLGKDKMDEDQKEKFIKKFKKDHEYQLFNDEKKSLGTIGIGIDLYTEIMDNAKTAYTGQYTQDYMGNESERFLLPKDQDNIKNAVIFETLFALGIVPRDVNTVTKNIIKLSKKNSLTETQYEKYKAVGKETGAKVTGWKMDLTKSKSKLETTVSEIEWIEKHGGLNEKQGKEYVKLSAAFDEVSYRDLQRIQSGKTADQIINSYSKK